MAEMKELQVYDPATGEMTVDVDPEKGIGVRYTVTVHLSKDEVFVKGGKASINRAGADRIQKILGATIIMPPTVAWGGKDVRNPYTEKDAQGQISRVVVRTIGYSMSALGQPIVADYYLAYDLRLVWLKKLAKLAANYPAAAKLGPDGEGPDGSWVYYPVDDQVGYWLDLSKKEVQEKYSEFIQSRYFAERMAQSMCVRNTIHKLIGGPFAEPDGEGGWKKTLTVVKYQPIVDTQTPTEQVTQAIEETATTEGTTLLLDGAIVDEPDEVEPDAEVEETKPKPAPDPEPDTPSEPVEHEEIGDNEVPF